jgi:hypothetical protein
MTNDGGVHGASALDLDSPVVVFQREEERIEREVGALKGRPRGFWERMGSWRMPRARRF